MPKELFFENGEDQLTHGFAREPRRGPDEKILQDYWIKDYHNHEIGCIEEQKGLWGLWFRTGEDQKGQIYCHPDLFQSLEDAEIKAQELIGRTIEELIQIYPTEASWAK